MHFIDYLLHVLNLFYWILKTTISIIVEVIIPAIGYILPVIVKIVSQLISIILQIFFLYISPCLIHTVKGLTYIFTHTLSGINYIVVQMIESNINLELVYGIVFGSVLILVFYFRVTGQVWRFLKESAQIVRLNARFVVNIFRAIFICMKYIHGKIMKTKDSNAEHVKSAHNKR